MIIYKDPLTGERFVIVSGQRTPYVPRVQPVQPTGETPTREA